MPALFPAENIPHDLGVWEFPTDATAFFGGWCGHARPVSERKMLMQQRETTPSARRGREGRCCAATSRRTRASTPTRRIARDGFLVTTACKHPQAYHAPVEDLHCMEVLRYVR